MKFILVLLVAIAFVNCQAQKVPTITVTDTFVKLTGEVKIIDSQYILILRLAVSGNNKIKIDKHRHFDQGEYTIAANRIFLKKLVRNTMVNIYVSALKQHLYTEDWDKTINVTSQNSIIDSINLAAFYPFEMGTYIISAQMDYWHKSAKHFAELADIPFTVYFLPKQAPFN